MEKMTMTIKAVALATILLVGCFALAQSAPRVEVAAAYQFSTMTPNIGSGGTLQGWNGGVQYNFTHRFALMGEASGGYGSDRVSNQTLHTYLFGPRVSIYRGDKLNFYGHDLLGVGYLRASRGGSFDTSRALSSAAGAGVDLGVSKHVAVRVIQLDYLFTRFSQVPQHNFRFSTGLVLRLGGESKAK